MSTSPSAAYPPSRPRRKRPSLRGWILGALLFAAAAGSSPGATAPVFDLPTVEALLARATPGATTVTSGDMLFRVADLQAQRERLLRSARGIGPRAAVRVGVTTWPDGRVPYRFDASVTATQRSQFVAACAEWQNVARVTFVPATTEVDYVYVITSDRNTSYIGMVGGRQDLNMVSWNSKFIICHELGHALGLSHEQARSDRDTYVTINLENVQSGQAHNFAKYTTTNETPYDFESIMHYSRFAFSKNGSPTITPKPAYELPATTMGQLSRLSRYDIEGMINLYGSARANVSLQLRDAPIFHDGGLSGTTGNRNGQPERGETIAIELAVRNYGADPATNARITATESSPHAVFVTSNSALGTIAAGATVSSTALRLFIPANTPHGHAIPVTLTIASDYSSEPESIVVTVPELPSPTISPAGGFIREPQTVTLATTLAGATIRYTLDGTAPTFLSPVYAAPFTVSTSTVVRAIAVSADASSSPVSQASFYFVPPDFDVSLPFHTAELPRGWEIEVDPSRIEQASIVEGRFEVRESDTFAALQRTLPAPAATTAIRVAYTGNIADNALGMGSRIQLVMEDDQEYFISLARPNGDGAALDLRAGTGDPATTEQTLPADYGPYRVIAEFRDGRIDLDVRRSGARSPAYAGTIPVPLLDIHRLKTLRLVAFTTTGEPAWIDDVAISAVQPVFVPALPPPPAAPTLLTADIISAKQLEVSFRGADAGTAEYLVELRSRKANRKWTPWKTARRITPFDLDVYRTTLRTPKAIQHQVRVTAINPGGRNLSRPLTLKPGGKR